MKLLKQDLTNLIKLYKKYRTNSSDKLLCDIINNGNKMIILSFKDNTDYVANRVVRRMIIKNLRVLRTVIRISDKNNNKKILYSSISLELILREVIDKEFMRICGGSIIDDGFLDNNHIAEFASGIIKADKELTRCKYYPVPEINQR